MKPIRKSLSLLTLAIAASLALGACSSSDQSGTQDTMAPTPSASTVQPNDGPRDPAQRDAVSTPEAEATPSDNGMSVVDGQDGETDRTYLHDLLQKPAFAKAMQDMDGADKLPDWVADGGTATPAEMVEVGGKSLLAAQACKPHECPSEQVLVLYDQDAGTMQGVFVHDPSPGVDAGVSDQADMTWLGKPDDAVKTWLKQQVASR